tara:strand:- start:779 stop:1312 length:534 start_codon:yes stop_codon:yes gene_type:complete
MYTIEKSNKPDFNFKEENLSTKKVLDENLFDDIKRLLCSNEFSYYLTPSKSPVIFQHMFLGLDHTINSPHFESVCKPIIDEIKKNDKTFFNILRAKAVCYPKQNADKIEFDRELIKFHKTAIFPIIDTNGFYEFENKELPNIGQEANTLSIFDGKEKYRVKLQTDLSYKIDIIINYE